MHAFVGVATRVWFLFESWPCIRAIGSRTHLLFEHSCYETGLRIAREVIRCRAQAISEAIPSREREVRHVKLCVVGHEKLEFN